VQNFNIQAMKLGTTKEIEARMEVSSWNESYRCRTGECETGYSGSEYRL